MGQRHKPDDAAEPLDPALVRLIEALARAQARRDHKAEIAAAQKRQDQPDAQGSNIRALLV